MSKLDDIIKRTFMAGYGCGKKETGLQMVIASDVIEPAAKQQIKDLFLELIGEDEVKSSPGLMIGYSTEYIRDNLRAELRQKVSEV